MFCVIKLHSYYGKLIGEQYDDKLGNQNNCDKSDGICSCICGSYIIALCDIDKGSECRGRSHTACDTAQIVEEGKLDNVLCNNKADYHGNDSHERTLQEVDGLEVLYKACAAGDTCADKERHKTEFTEDLKHTLFRLH